MSAVSSVDIGFDLTPRNLLLLGIASTVIFVSLLLYNIFGTISPLKAKGIYSKHNELNEQYKNLFRKRDNLSYHISWARSRGEVNENTKTMISDLQKLDEDIDALEQHMKNVAKGIQK